ncbi:MAG TPA: Crp/Fnr family transcriptional regulator [Kiritimatiellia bacterium]|nr:Crp/Fnr family transcriptional regulator [Kiritimatiellia bacterium]
MSHPTNALATSPLFAGMNPAHRQRLAEASFKMDLEKGEILFHEGDQGGAVYLLTRGNVQAGKTDANGNHVIIKVFKPGEMFAQVILFESPAYPVTATAITDATVIGLHRRDLLVALREEAFRCDFIGQLMRRQRFLANRLASLSSPDIEDRLRQFLLEQYGTSPKIICPLRRKDMAAAIGVTAETLSRLLTRLKKAGKLSWRHDVIAADPSFWA